MSLACMELQLEQWSLNKGKTGESHYRFDPTQTDRTFN